MLVVEVLGGALGAALAVVTAAVALVGILGMLGTIRILRCDHCGHLGLASGSGPLRSCTLCRHERLLHPLEALGHHDAVASPATAEPPRAPTSNSV